MTLNVPIFSGFLIQNRVNETRALEQKARTDAEGAHNSVVLGTRTAFVTALTQAAQVKALEAAEASSKLALDATLLGYKVGVKVNLDVLNAQSQLYNTQTRRRRRALQLPGVAAEAAPGGGQPHQQRPAADRRAAGQVSAPRRHGTRVRRHRRLTLSENRPQQWGCRRPRRERKL